jgi:NADPH:quinone reductase-like Zn-dependent oxidoreductase
LLIRGGTTSVGLAAAALAKEKGAFVAATTRNASRETMLKDLGIDDVIIDDGVIAQEVRRKWPQGFDKILELVGVTTLEDSLKCAAPAGTVCMTGIAGGKWTFDQFNPMTSIPTAVRLTTYAGSAEDLLLTPVDDIAAKVLSGAMKLPIKTFKMEDIVEAHRSMEHEGAVAKIVMLTS